MDCGRLSPPRKDFTARVPKQEVCGMTDYEMVIGLEVHVELKTNSKIFCGCPTAFAAAPNTQCCPVCMGLPGSLPVLNRKVVELAVRAGLATNCEIARFSRLDRKHYFYPDLPKAYQISQFDLPLCAHGYVQIGEKRVGITRIHIEEDAGKLTHTPSGETLIDFNRCGVPLIEIVSEPDMRSAQEAREYLASLRAILVAAGVSDCRMEEGSMRCDVNLSVRFPGQELGVRTEIKNLNSFANVVRAIEAEYARQAAVLRAGGNVEQETRRFDPESGQTLSMRRKENADDYRYFPDPDLPPVALSSEWIDHQRASLRELPDARRQRLTGAFGLNGREAGALAAAPALCDCFEAAWNLTGAREALKSLVVSRLAHDPEDVSPAPEALAALAEMLAAGTLGAGGAAKALAAHLETGESAQSAAERLNLAQISDRETLIPLVEAVLAENGALVTSFRAGRVNALKGLMGAVMAKTQGRANPQATEALLRERMR